MNFSNQPVVIDNPHKKLLIQSEILKAVANSYGFKQPVPAMRKNERAWNAKFNAWKVQLNEFTKGYDRLPVGCIDVLTGKGDYPEVNVSQKKEPKVPCVFNHPAFA